MKIYRRIMIGRKSVYAEECLKGTFIGADFLIVTRNIDFYRYEMSFKLHKVKSSS